MGDTSKTAFAGGKRVEVDFGARQCKIQGKQHIDRFHFVDARGRVDLYRKLMARRKAKRDEKGTAAYAASLAAAEKALDMIKNEGQP